MASEFEQRMVAQQRELFSKLDDHNHNTKSAIQASTTLVIQQCQQFVQQAIEPLSNNIADQQKQLEKALLMLELHNQRFEKLDAQMETD
eukprot:2312398-Karenia_brevis.AAC.1